MRITKGLFKYGASFAIGLLALLYLTSALSSIVSAASLAQGYHSSQPVTVGSIVSLTQSGGSEIKTTDLLNEDLMLGIAVDSSNAIVDLQPTGSDVRVAINGEAPVLVSNENGDINPGDNLIISQVAGVAMKDSSDSNAKRYIGVASEKFNASSPQAKQVTIKDGNNDKTVRIGLIKAKILLSDRKSSSKSNPVLSYIQKLVGKPVGTAQIVGSVAVFITTLVFTALVINGTVKGAFVSIGRNPLSRPSIISNMLRVSLICLVTLAAGASIAYAILLI